MNDRIILVCDCSSLEHQVCFWYDGEDKELYCTIHLTHYDSIFKRIRTAVKYIFGHKSRFGEWDETYFNDKELTKLRKYLDENIKLTPQP